MSDLRWGSDSCRELKQLLVTPVVAVLRQHKEAQSSGHLFLHPLAHDGARVALRLKISFTSYDSVKIRA